jgi:small-conductance mechanosensitive channel
MLPNIIIYNNSLADWLLAIGIAFIIFAAALFARRVSRQKLSVLTSKTINAWDDLLVELVGRLNGFFFLAVAWYLGSIKLSLPNPAGVIFGHAVAIIVLIQIAVLSSHTVNFWVAHIRRQKIENDAGTVTTLTSVGFVLRMLIWIILILIVLDNLGVDITALVAGLGITGIAVALALQNILGDLFGSFSIVLDKPFVIGDFIVIDDYMGTIEHIGLKTTRIRSLSGEQLIFSNADLLKSRIRNYKRMNERRVIFSLGVVYRTPAAKLSQIPEMIRRPWTSTPRRASIGCTLRSMASLLSRSRLSIGLPTPIITSTWIFSRLSIWIFIVNLLMRALISPIRPRPCLLKDNLDRPTVLRGEEGVGGGVSWG